MIPVVDPIHVPLLLKTPPVGLTVVVLKAALLQKGWRVLMTGATTFATVTAIVFDIGQFNMLGLTVTV